VNAPAALLKPDDRAAASSKAGDDDDDLEALRIAALNSMKPKKSNDGGDSDTSWEEYSEYETDSEAEAEARRQEEIEREAKERAAAEERRQREEARKKAAKEKASMEDEEAEDVLNVHCTDEMDDLLNEFEQELDPAEGKGSTDGKEGHQGDKPQREKKMRRVVKKRKKVKKAERPPSPKGRRPINSDFGLRGGHDGRQQPVRPYERRLPPPPRHYDHRRSPLGHPPSLMDFSHPPPGYYPPRRLSPPPIFRPSPPIPYYASPPRRTSPLPPPPHGYGRSPSPYDRRYDRRWTPPPPRRGPHSPPGYRDPSSPPRNYWRSSRSPPPPPPPRSRSPRSPPPHRSGRGGTSPRRSDSAPRRLDDRPPLTRVPKPVRRAGGSRSPVKVLDEAAKSRSLPPKERGGSTGRADMSGQTRNGDKTTETDAQREERRFQARLLKSSPEEKKRLLARKDKFSREPESKTKVISLRRRPEGEKHPVTNPEDDAEERKAKPKTSVKGENLLSSTQLCVIASFRIHFFLLSHQLYSFISFLNPN
jgi:hypothetical protein